VRQRRAAIIRQTALHEGVFRSHRVGCGRNVGVAGRRFRKVASSAINGARLCRAEGTPLLEAKFRHNLARRFDQERQERILGVSLDQTRLEAMAVNDYVDLYVS
jgi:2-methylcitrate dehydratase PrpD